MGTAIGAVAGVASSAISGGLFSITIDNLTGTPAPPTAAAAKFILYLKNSVAESHGIRGYVLEFTLSNNLNNAAPSVLPFK